MSRVKTGPSRRRKHKKVLETTKGFRMSNNRLIKRAKEALLHASEYAFRGRKERKRQFRSLWIKRINAGLKNIAGAPSYSVFINTLSTKSIALNRKILAHLALEHPKVFSDIVKSSLK